MFIMRYIDYQIIRIFLCFIRFTSTNRPSVMKKSPYLATIIALIFGFSKPITVCGQALKSSKSISLQLDAGPNFHGTGDLAGYGFNVEASTHLKGKFSATVGIGSTIGQGTLPLSYFDGAGEAVDASYRITTGGIQLSSKVGFEWISAKKFNLGTRLGALTRFQSTSAFDDYAVFFPIATGYPMPLTSTIHRSPQNTVAIGGLAQCYTNYFVNDHTYLGINASWQIDTRGDAIAQLMLHIGYRIVGQ